MENEPVFNRDVYSKNVLEFVTVAVEFCNFVEYANRLERKDFIEKSLKILPLLYLKTSMLPASESVYDDMLEDFVTEDDYNAVRHALSALLGKFDAYLEVFHPDMNLSETPIASSIAEGIADMYQDLKNFTLNYRIGAGEVMEESVAVCIEQFKERWGQLLLNALKALHAVFYSEELIDDDSEREKDNREKYGSDSLSTNFFGFRDDDPDQYVDIL